jgi:hypothetical protein
MPEIGNGGMKPMEPERGEPLGHARRALLAGNDLSTMTDETKSIL